MCGIAGIVSSKVVSKDHSRLVAAMAKSLAHRGPDDAGLIETNHAILAHRRLAIIDPEHARQPMQSEDGSITLVFNGEIYNYVELRRQMVLEGATFRTTSDSEVLLKLYEKEGERCLRRLNGMFAFAILDSRAHKFFAARDHFGIKPFYYATTGNHLVFASEIKALCFDPALRPEVDVQSLQEYLTFQFCLGAKTLFKSIRKLEPAQCMSWSYRKEASPKIRTYWKKNYSIDTHHTEEYFLDTLYHLLDDSVRQQLRSDVPVGAYLSGGHASLPVSSLAARRYGKGLRCFAGRFDEGAGFDETGYARAVARKSGLTLETVTPTERNFVDWMPKLIYSMDEPMAGPGLFPQHAVSRLAAKRVKVVLGGQGGDEIFGGYARYLIAYLEQCLKGAIHETQEEGKFIVTLHSIVQNLPLLKEYVPMLKDFWAKGLFGPMDRRYFRLIDRSHDLESILSPEFKGIYDKESLFDTFSTDFNAAGTKSYINKMLHFDQKTLLPALLHIEDRMSMAVSVESRVPLLDTRIVELVNAMPPALKFKEGKLKHALRQAVKNVLPREIVARRDKMGFPVPLKKWMRKGPVRDFVRDTLQSQSARKRGIFDAQALDTLLSSEGDFGRQVWGALCLELWYREFIDKSWKLN